RHRLSRGCRRAVGRRRALGAAPSRRPHPDASLGVPRAVVGQYVRMVDSRQRFSATADAYHRYRPDYPQALLDWLVAETGVASGARVADIGCGTGISSRFLAARGFRVVGVDANADMLARAVEAGGGPRYVVGEAVATGLPDRSVDLVTAAQSFHW